MRLRPKTIRLPRFIGKRFLFDRSENAAGTVRLYAALFAENKKDVKPGDRTIIQLARVVEFQDHFYGKVKLDRKLFKAMIKNFDANIFGQEIFIDVSHNPHAGAAATVRKLFMDGSKFRAEVVWTEYGIDAVKKRGMKYLSIDFTENYIDPEDKDHKEHGPLLFGAGLTTRPRVKHQETVQLSDQVDDPDAQSFGITPNIEQTILNETKTMDKALIRYRKHLKTLALAQGVQDSLITAFTNAGEGLDEAAALLLCASFEATATQLSEQVGQNEAVIQLSVPNTPADNTDAIQLAVTTALEAQRAADDAALESQATQLSDRQGQFDTLMATAFHAETGNLRSLSETNADTVRSMRSMITADMSAEQVVLLADAQIAIGDQLVVAMQLGQQGYGVPTVGGTPHISVDQSNGVLQLGETVRGALLNTSQFTNGQLTLSEELSPFARQALALYDQQNMPRLLAENTLLAGGSTGIVDTNVPAGFQRTVITEALHDLNIMQLVQTLTDGQAQVTTQIPFEARDMSAVVNGGVVYEGQGIPGASVSQDMDTAYLSPMKLSMLVSNEVMHITQASGINWEAWGRNVASNARIMRELIATRISNEMQRIADSYGAIAVSTPETASVSSGAFKTASFPVVRSHQVRDLKGTAIGNPSNPIVVKDGATVLAAYDGSNKQSAGTYYRVLSYNLGRFLICNQLGAATAPAGTVTITYWRATNIALFDSDLPANTTKGQHYNELLRKFGAQKAMMKGTRYTTPNFALMSPTLNDELTSADQFVASLQRSGSNTDNDGDLDRIKGISSHGTNAPGIDLGDERIILGERNTTTYTIAKAFVTGAPFEEVNSDGLPTGRKQAYGEEYSSVHTPAPIANRYTSILSYSASNR